MDIIVLLMAEEVEFVGKKDNFKITFPEDLNLAKSILISQGRMDKKS